jgi:hypothetical protein
MDVIQDSSFEEVELSTIITILDQDDLNVDSEISLFFALNRFAEKHGFRHDSVENSAEESQSIPQVNVEAGPSNRPDVAAPVQPQRVQEPSIRDAGEGFIFQDLKKFFGRNNS